MNDDLFQALTSHDLKVPQPLVTLKAGDQVLKDSNLGNDARYDQILYQSSAPLAAAKSDEAWVTAGGPLNFYPNETIIEKLFPGKKMTRDKFSSQLREGGSIQRLAFSLCCFSLPS